MPPGPNPALEDKKSSGISQEDVELKERLDLAVERLMEGGNPELQRAAIELLRKEIREATSSMTSVPKPLKFLAEHWPRLQAYFIAIGGVVPTATPTPEELKKEAAGGAAAGGASSPTAAAAAPAPAPAIIVAPPSSLMTDENRRVFADVLSVLALTMGKTDARETLRYKLVGNTEDLETWGHGYVRTLAGEIGQEYQARALVHGGGVSMTDLLGMVRRIIPFNMTHNAEVEGVDLLLETDQLLLLQEPGMVDAHSVSRVCLYLLKCGDYLGDDEEVAVALEVAFNLYLANKAYPDALRTALRIAGPDVNTRLTRVFAECADRGVRLQLGYMLGRARVDFETDPSAPDAAALAGAIGNQSLSSLFMTVARDLDVMEAKTPEDVYKSHLAGERERGAVESTLSSSRANLASTYVNAFVNAGYGNDKLLSLDDSDWVFSKNKDSGMMAAAASVGLLNLWDESAISKLDKYVEGTDDYVRGGGLLGVALACAGTKSDASPAFGLLSEHAEFGSSSGTHMRIGAILGLGIAYAGSRREDLTELLSPHIIDTEGSLERTSMAALALGMIHAGSANPDIASTIANRLVECSEVDSNQSITRHLVLGLGLLFLGQGTKSDTILAVVSAFPPSLSGLAEVLIKACAYAGTGDVLQIQALLRVCAEHPEVQDKQKAADAATAESTRQDKAAAEASLRRGGAAAGGGAAGGAGGAAGANLMAMLSGGAGGAAGAAAAAAAGAVDASGKYLHQSVSVLGLALLAMGEELSVELATRMSDHLLQYGDTAVRRAVPLALALLHLSDPAPSVVDQLSRLSHDPNEETSQAAIFGMGLVGAGTNNSRIAGLLRTLAVFYKTSANHLFVVRLAQGILHAGKGLMTLSPLHSDRLLVSHVGLACILPAIFLFLDPKTSLHATGSKWHILLFTLASALNPRFMITVSEEASASEDATGPVPVAVEVRVGQAVETVGQAGRPKTITGFQTHTTPVLIGAKDRAELADEAYTPLTSVLEGVVVLRKNPDAKKGKAASAAAAAAAGAAAAGGGAAGGNK